MHQFASIWEGSGARHACLVVLSAFPSRSVSFQSLHILGCTVSRFLELRVASMAVESYRNDPSVDRPHGFWGLDGFPWCAVLCFRGDSDDPCLGLFFSPPPSRCLRVRFRNSTAITDFLGT